MFFANKYLPQSIRDSLPFFLKIRYQTLSTTIPEFVKGREGRRSPLNTCKFISLRYSVHPIYTFTVPLPPHVTYIPAGYSLSQISLRVCARRHRRRTVWITFTPSRAKPRRGRLDKEQFRSITAEEKTSHQTTGSKRNNREIEEEDEEERVLRVCVYCHVVRSEFIILCSFVRYLQQDSKEEEVTLASLKKKRTVREN